MTRRLVLAVALAVGLVLNGCAVATDPTWTPPAWGESSLTFPDAPDPVDAAGVAGIVGSRLRQDAIGVQARVALLPGAAPVNERLLGIVRGVVGARSAATGATYAPQAFPAGAGMADRACVRGSTLRPAPELLADPALGAPDGTGAAVACDIVAAVGTVFGERLRVVVGSGGVVESDVSSILYTDVTSGETATARELWLPEASGALWTALVDALRRRAGSLSLASIGPPDEAALAAFVPALDSTVPGGDGSLAIIVPAGFTAPELAALGAEPTAEPLTVGVPAALAATLVAPLGHTLVTAGAAATPYQAPAQTPAGHGPVDCSLFPCVALTYDDGPSEHTGQMLDALGARRASATFFVLGSAVARYGDVIRRAAAEGHEVANHTWNHPDLTTLSSDGVARQIRDTSGAIEAATGRRATMFRPPYGEYDAAVVEAAGLPAILWDVDTLDWKGAADDHLIRYAVDTPRPGSIVLQHDIHGNTARTVGAIADGLLDRGFSLVTVSQLFGGTVPASGAWRSAR